MYLCKPLCFNDNAKIQNLEPKNKECSPVHQNNMKIKRRLVLLLQYLIQTFHDIARRILQPMLRLRLIGCDETLSHGFLVFQGEALAQVIRHFEVYFPGSFGKRLSEIEFHEYQLLPVCRLQRILILVAILDFKYHKTPISSNHLVATGGYRMNNNVIKKIKIVSILNSSSATDNWKYSRFPVPRYTVLLVSRDRSSAGRNFT